MMERREMMTCYDTGMGNYTDAIPTNSKKVLFIGNSATQRNDIPQTFSRLAQKAGYCVEASAVLRGGAMLTEYADPTCARGKMAFDALESGAYDIVFLQDNSNCIVSEERRAETEAASKILNDRIRRTGASTYFYVRPPTGKDLFGYDSYSQCLEYDKLFGKIAEELGATNVYVNRAFAYVIKHKPDVGLWGPDNAHTSPVGAYLAVCVFFATVFGTSATVLDSNDLPNDVARFLQQAADKIVLEKFIPQ